MKVLIDFDLKTRYIEQLKEKVPEANFVTATEHDKIKNEIGDAEVLVNFKNTTFDIVKEAGSLKWIQSWTAGVDKYISEEYLDYLLENEIVLTNMSGVHSNIIAEHTLGFMINFSRRFCDFYDQKKDGIWNELKVGQLENRTLAVIGLGSIGSEIARRGKAFKMKVIGTKRNVDEEIKGVDEIYSPNELMTVLSQSDYVVSMVPLTDDTEEMFGAEEFEAMKETAYFINMARGEVVDEPALIEALKKKKIAGAGLDVFAEEPLSENSPLYNLDNVLMTPHVAGVFPEYNEKAVKILAENLEKFAYSDVNKMINVVDYDLGY